MGKRAISAGLFVAAIALAVGLYLFQPWRIFTSSTVTEDIPAAAPLAVPSQVYQRRSQARPPRPPHPASQPRPPLHVNSHRASSSATNTPARERYAFLSSRTAAGSSGSKALTLLMGRT